MYFVNDICRMKVELSVSRRGLAVQTVTSKSEDWHKNLGHRLNQDLLLFILDVYRHVYTRNIHVRYT